MNSQTRKQTQITRNGAQGVRDMTFYIHEKKLIESIIRTEDLEISLSDTFTTALGDTVFSAKGPKEDMEVLREVYRMVS